LTEVLNQVLKQYPEDLQKKFLQNILLTVYYIFYEIKNKYINLKGGASLINNLKKRIEIDLKSSNPVGTIININIVIWEFF